MATDQGPVGPDELEIVPFDHRIDATIRPPGSKSITNRALVCAALADGESRLDGVLVADDTEAMLVCLRDLGVAIRLDRDAGRATITGVAGAPAVDGAVLDARLSGTTSRFVLPVAALGRAFNVRDFVA